MYCKTCGTRINDDSQFCYACGQKCNIVQQPSYPPIAHGTVNEAVACPICKTEFKNLDPGARACPICGHELLNRAANTNVQISKSRKQLFAIGLSGLIVVLLGWFVCLYIVALPLALMTTGSAGVDEAMGFSMFLVFAIPALVGIINGSIAMAKARNLEEIGMLTGPAKVGHVLGKVAFGLGIGVLGLMLFIIVEYIS